MKNNVEWVLTPEIVARHFFKNVGAQLGFEAGGGVGRGLVLLWDTMSFPPAAWLALGEQRLWGSSQGLRGDLMGVG